MAHAKRKRKLVVKQPLPKSTPAKHVRGFGNLGNTCFMNSALQCLLASELLVSFFLHQEFRPDLNASSPTRGALASAFAGLVRSVWGATNDVIYPSELKQQFERAAPEFYGNRYTIYFELIYLFIVNIMIYSNKRQHDAQEFLRFLLDGMHEDLNRVKVRPRLVFDEKVEDKLR
jgi:ubiquitin C-terminal hydrolase